MQPKSLWKFPRDGSKAKPTERWNGRLTGPRPRTPAIVLSILALAFGVTAFVASGGVAGADPLFPYPVFDASTYSSTVLMRDLNADRIPDIIINSGGGLQVHLGEADGHFVSKFVRIGQFGSAVAVEDVNLDGHLDIVNGESAMLGAGDGSFGLSYPLEVEEYIFGLAASEFTGDHLPDIAVVTYGGTLSILPGHGNGRFGAPKAIGAGLSTQRSIQAADLNADGRADLIGVNAAGSAIVVHMSLVGGAFVAVPDLVIGPRLSGMDVADVDGDAWPDLMVYRRCSESPCLQNGLVIFRGMGDGEFFEDRRLREGETVTGAVARDLDGDGILDLASVGETGDLVIHRGLPSGGFDSPRRLAVGINLNTMVASEINDDPPPDLIVIDRTMGRAMVLFDPGLEGFPLQQQIELAAQPFFEVTGDWNGDGRADIALGTNRDNGYGAGFLTFVVSAAGGIHQVSGTIDLAASIRSIAQGDVDSDGRPDLAVLVSAATSGMNNLVVLRGIGNGTFEAPRLAGSVDFQGQIAFADADGDAHSDLFLYGGLRTAAFLIGADGLFSAPVQTALGASTAALALADFTGDGRADLVASSYYSGSPYEVVEAFIMPGRGDGTWDQRVQLVRSTYYPNQLLRVLTGDLNGDGNMDLLLSPLDAGRPTVEVYLGHGDATFGPPIPLSSLHLPSVIADFNGDGIVDLGGRGNDVFVHLGLGGGTFEVQRRFAAYNGGQSFAQQLYWGDFTGDGMIDFAVPRSDRPGIVVLPNLALRVDEDRDGVPDIRDGCVDPDGDGRGTPGSQPPECGVDNCPAAPNPGQSDLDGDGRGDACDLCPVAFDPAQGDRDGDGAGDACDTCTDTDGDGHSDGSGTPGGCSSDNCIAVTNADQADADGDGRGDACDACPGDPQDDTDRDGICAEADNCPHRFNPTQEDGDTDGAGDDCDNCGGRFNPDQRDGDGDRIGDVCQAQFAGDLFAVPVTPILQNGTIYPTLGDFDGDGRLDFAAGRNGFIVAEQRSFRDLAIYLDTGAGHFALTYSMPFALYYAKTAVGDFDGDGAMDLAFGDSDRVVVYPGHGDGSFGAEFMIPIQGFPAALAAADLDRDGKDDLILSVSRIGSSDDPLVVLPGLGPGRFGAAREYPEAALTTIILTGNLNGDPYPDVVLRNACTVTPCPSVDWFAVFLGSADGSLRPGPRLELDGWPAAMTLADINKDGRDDVIGITECQTEYCYAHRLAVFVGNGDGTFTGQIRDLPSSVRPNGSIGAADFDNDGAADLFVGMSDRIVTLAGDGLGGFVLDDSLSMSIAGYGSQLIGVTQLDGDGSRDLLCVSRGSRNVFALPGRGDGTFGTGIARRTAGYLTTAAALDDFNDDGITDIAAVAYYPAYNQVPVDGSVLLGHGDGTFQEAPGFAGARYGGAYGVSSGDFNSDGKRDLSVADLGSTYPYSSGDYGALAVVAGQGDGTFGPPTYSGLYINRNPAYVAVGDYDRDGDEDLAVANSGAGTVAIHFGDGRGVFRDPDASSTYSTGDGPFWIASGDLNDDGARDLVVANAGGDGYTGPRSGSVAVLLGAGNGTFKPGPTIEIVGNANSVALGDLDGDGDEDLLVADGGFIYRVLVYSGRGDGSFEANGEVEVGRTPFAVVVSDFNTDGRLDMATANIDSADVSVRLGLGDGTFGPESRFGSGSNTFYIVAGHLNSDRRVDLAVPMYDGVAVLQNRGPFPDSDADGVSDENDPCTDKDGDGVGDPLVSGGTCGADNCPDTPNPNQENRDLDRRGDACDRCPESPTDDADGDGVCDNIDTCLGVHNVDQTDADADGRGDACDNCPGAANPGQEDVDQDGAGDACQPVLILAGILEDGGFDLEVDAIARDPQGETLSGVIRIDQTLPEPASIANFNPSFDCSMVWSPIAGYPGALVYAYFDEGSYIVLGDVFTLLGCPEVTASIYFAEASCEDPYFDWTYFIDLTGRALPRTLCVTPADFSSPAFTLVLLDAGSDGLKVERLIDSANKIPFADGLPPRVPLTGLTPGGAHRLTLTVTDGYTPSRSASRDFLYSGESSLVIRATGPAGDQDADGIEDAIDTCIDTDGDGFREPWSPEGNCAPDNCPSTFNPSQGDPDQDGLGTECDNCALVANEDQVDSDSDGHGDVCDACPADPDGDLDGDSVCRETDNCPAFPNPDQMDDDRDELGNACDNCPVAPNPDQIDTDFDGHGDACDDCQDTDQDGWGDAGGGDGCGMDNCLQTPNPGQQDSDADGAGDACDSCPLDPLDDADGDGLCGDVDRCAAISNPMNLDPDGDGVGSVCDNCPRTANGNQLDGDGDGLGDACEPRGGRPIFPGSVASVGNDPSHILFADTNKDGRTDTIVLTREGVTVLPGEAAGLFGRGATTAAGWATGYYSPVSPRLVDLDGDGYDDLFVLSSQQGAIYVHKGLPDGTFGAASPDPVYGAGAALGDVDGDGRVELVTVTQYWAYLFERAADGHFVQRSRMRVGDDPRLVTLADVDRDGRLDIVTVNYKSKDLSVLTGWGNGQFRGQLKSPLQIAADRVVFQDVDGDRFLDVIAAGGKSVTVLSGDGLGRFVARAAMSLQQNITAIAAGDFTHDGVADLAIGKALNDYPTNTPASVALFRGAADFRFTPIGDYLTGRQSTALTIADMNGDDRDDLAVTTRISAGVHRLEVILAASDGSLPESPVSIAQGPDTIALFARDLDLDGHVDLVATEQYRTRVLKGNGLGGFSIASTQNHAGASRVEVGDFNGDHVDDFLRVSGSLADFHSGDGRGGFATVSVQSSLVPDPRAILAVDLDHDGRIELVVANYIGLHLFRSDGTGELTRNALIAIEGGADSIAAGDFNGDGLPDLAATSHMLNANFVVLSTGGGNFASGTLPGAGEDPDIVTAGDFDGDGWDDIVVGNTGSNDLSLFRGLGDGRFAAQEAVPFGQRPSRQIAGDFAGDGSDELIVAAEGSSLLSLFAGGPGWASGSPHLHQAGGQMKALAAADFDEDGDLDLAVGANGVAILFNTGAGADADLDGLPDDEDPCVDVDHDGYGSPGYPSSTCILDNCPIVANADQADADQDGPGNVCDNCPGAANEDQMDSDDDGPGDACDPCTDVDGDGLGAPGLYGQTCPVDSCPRSPDPSNSDRDGDGAGDVCDPCTDPDRDGLGTPGFAGQNCAMDNCPAAANPDQADVNADGSGDACQPSIAVMGIRQDGGEMLEVDARIADPQEEPLSGTVRILSTTDKVILLDDALAANDCNAAYLPDSLAGRGIAYTYGAVGAPYLFDLDSNLNCQDYNYDYLIALGPCAAPITIPETFLSMEGLVPPFEVCVRRVEQPDGGVQLVVRSMDFDQLRMTTGSTENELSVPFSGALPERIAIDNLIVGQPYRLEVEVTDGNTVPVTGVADFLYQGERLMTFNHAPVAVPTYEPRVECTGPMGAEFLLGGSQSHDPDSTSGTNDDIVEFIWWVDRGASDQGILGTGETLRFTLPRGEHRLTLVVVDRAGETGSADFMVTVTDTRPPVLSCPTVESVECAGFDGSPVQVMATATELCSGPVVLRNDRTARGGDASGIYPPGSTTVTFTATDGRFNQTQCTVSVNVRDTTPPLLTVAVTPTVLWPPNHEMWPVRVAWQASDVCDPNVRVELVSVASSEPDDSPGLEDGETSGDIAGTEIGTADAEVMLRAERSGQGSGRTYQIHYRAVDAAGGSTPAMAVVTVPHDLGQGPETILIQTQRTDSGALRLHWPAFTGATGYAVIRGDLSALALRDRRVSLGTVQVLQAAGTETNVEENLADAVPPPGHGFFYLVQAWTEAGGTGYGTESCPWPRIPDACAGGCPAPPPQ